ncbi:MASE3 domain-containing protein [Ferrovibrio sp.]|uniref:MASE3 domain-containing protein n=1 Tax=Ferrovibrio sp. TaxID=1917215 RepID=UPI00263459DE|nr:MASE3 domain-containing protein [Ferrovibrio sp.]
MTDVATPVSPTHSAMPASLRAAALQTWYFPVALSVFLAAVAQFNFLVFHTLAELFSIIVSFILFALAWHTHRFSRDHFLLYLACGMFWIGALDLAHTLTYKGMGLLPVNEANTATQVWVVARYLQALLLLTAPLMARHSPDKMVLFLVFGLMAALAILWIGTGHFPDAFIEGQGLTTLKIWSEYAIMVILAGALALIWANRATIAPDALPFLLIAIVFAIGTELAFTLYIDVYGVSNLVGHILKLFSFWAIFQAVALACLIRPYQELAASNRAKDDFLASMSHDLRTPLNSILGFSDMMRSRMFGPLGHAKYEDYVDNIHASGTHLLGLVNDILDLSKLESGQYQLNRQELNPMVLAEAVVRSFAPSITAKDMSVAVHCDPEIRQLTADERAMIQLLNNLVSNAVKFTPDNGAITVAWSRRPDGAMVLQVSDTGPGIPADQLKRLGKPYVQVDPYVAQKGTGLGLFIARRIAELHGAKLRITSRPGEGTAVTVTFPPQG